MSHLRLFDPSVGVVVQACYSKKICRIHSLKGDSRKRDDFVACVQDNIGEDHTHGVSATDLIINMQAHMSSYAAGSYLAILLK